MKEKLLVGLSVLAILLSLTTICLVLSSSKSLLGLGTTHLAGNLSLGGSLTSAGSSISVSGVSETWLSSAISNASTTICSFTSPAATSTLAFASVNIGTASTTVMYVDIAKGLASMATSTQFGDTYRTTASIPAVITASTTSALGENLVFMPSTKLVVKYSTATAVYCNPNGLTTCNSLVGTCKAKFITN